MNLPKLVANIRFLYHGNMLDICNVAHQLGLMNDDKAEEKCKFHAMQSIDAIERIFGHEALEKALKSKSV